MNEKRRIAVFIILLLAILVGSAFVYFFTKINQPASNESISTPVMIEKGWSTKQIAAKLDAADIINNPTIFTLYVYSKGAQAKIQAGEYLLDRKMSIAEIVEIITNGRVISNEHRITIVEGWSNSDIRAYLESRNIQRFDLALEEGDFDFEHNDLAKQFHYIGFLFPDTYTVSKNATAKELVQKMLTNFESKLTDQILADIQSSGRNLGDVLILASIIEKEVGRNKEKITAQDKDALQQERKLVASVFYNRLDKGMPLQSDATVNYVTGKKDRQPLFEDIKVKSPYNTYVVKGLPPGPIGNPGIDSIKAAIYPASSDYLYFLNKIDGEAVFAKTLEEHNQNRAKYLDN